MLRYKCCPLVVIFVLGLFLGSCAQPGGPAAGLNPNQTNDGDTQPDGSSTEDNQANDSDTQPGESSDDDIEYPEGWEDWEEDQEDPPVVTGIEIASLPDITVYPQSFTPEDLDFSGLVVYRVWNNGQTTELKSRVVLAEGYQTDPSGYTIDTKNIKATPGWSVPCPVYIRWGSFPAAEFSVVVDESNRVLQSVTASGSLPASQELGRAFQFGSLKVTGTYKEDEVTTTAPIDSKAYKVTGYDMRKRGDQTVTIRVNGKPVGAYSITVKAPSTATVKALEMLHSYIPGRTSGYRPVYLKGQEFSLADSKIIVTLTANGQNLPLAYGDGGFTGADLEDPDSILSGGRFVKAGNQKLRIKLDDAPAVDIPFYVIGDVEGAEPRVYFDYGYRQTETDKTGKGWGDGSYYVKSGSSIVLAPARYLIGYRADHTDDGASYSWTVTGGDYDTGVSHNGETFTLKPGAATFPTTYTVSVSVTGRNFITGSSDTKTAVTEVVCYSETMSSDKTFQGPLKDFAPGQFTERGSGYGWSLGAALGYEVWDATNGSSATSVTSAKITGNAFASWSEPGIVWIQADDNGNGLPDETWHELKGSDDGDSHKTEITRRYALTYIRDALSEAPPNQYGQIIRSIYWADQRGRAGIIGGGWPSAQGLADKGINPVDGTWITFTGTLLRDSKGIELNTNKGSQTVTCSGYVDAYGGDGIFRPGSAINADGTAAGLTSFRFVKVQNAYFDYGTSVGEYSTEIVSGTGLEDQSGGFPLP
jgi:hypothetical protein